MMNFLIVLLSVSVVSFSFQLSAGEDPLTYPSRCCVEYHTPNKNTPGVNACGHGDRPTGASFASRSPSVGMHGMAASSQPLVSAAAINILKQGGSAVDAAIAANIMQSLVEPMSCGAGGDVFAIVSDPSTKRVYGYNGSGRSAMNFTFDEMDVAAYNITGSHFIPTRGPLAVTVPGAVQGWCDLHARFGKLSFEALFAETIDRANNGFVVTQVIGAYFQSGYRTIMQSASAQQQITSDGLYPQAIDGFNAVYTLPLPNGTRVPVSFGAVFTNKALAETYTQVAAQGCDAFYRGELARTMAAYLQSVGSHLTYDDFANHHGDWVDTVNITYRGDYLVSELPPNPQGIAALQMLNMMELYPYGTDPQFTYHSTDYLHTSLEIKKLVFADRAKYYADMDYADVCVPVTQLISKEYAVQRNQLINMSMALNADQVVAGELNCTKETEETPKKKKKKKKKKKYYDPYEGDTIYLTVADSDGMMASWIQSNYNGFGSGLVSPVLGFAFQDRGALFSLQPETNNQYNVGKRPFHTIIPGFLHQKNATDDTWTPLMSFGVMGGNMQPQGHVQILSNIIDFGMNIQEAGDAARWEHSGSQQPTGKNVSRVDGNHAGTVTVESGICLSTANELIQRGHEVRYGGNGGGYQGILRDPQTGVYFGATEMRKDGIALGY